MTAPLEGIRVLELDSWMASPSAGAILSDLGADVVKLEPPAGDTLRGLGRQAKHPTAEAVDHPFQAANRGKRSICVALDKPGGSELVHRLAADVDVFMCNLIVPRQERYRVAPADILAVNPRAVHATLSGYGRTGPDAARPGYDVTAFFGRGAITDSQLEPGGVPPMPRTAQGDYTTGLALVASILAALRMVELTGEGQVVDVSLMHTAIWTMATDLAPTLVDRNQPSRRDRRHMILPLSNRFPCSDGRWIIVNMPEPHWWPRFCEVIGKTEWIDDPELTTVKQRFDRMPELIDGIDEVMLTRTAAEWGELFDAAGLIWGPASTLVDLVDDPHARATNMFASVDHETGAFDTVAVPIRIEGADIAPRGPAPELGAHTGEVLAEAGLAAGEIDELRSAGVIV